MSYSSTILAYSPLFYARLSDASGATTAADASGNGLTGTDAGTVTPGAAGLLPYDAATSTAFGGGYINVGTPASLLAVNRSFTLMAWVKPTASGDIGIIGFGAARPYVRLSGGKIDFLASQVADLINGATTLPLNAVSFVAVTVGAGSTANVKLYANGSLDGATTTTQTFTGGNPYVTIGSDGNAGGYRDNFFAGSMQEVAVIGSELSAAQLAAIYAAGTTPSSWLLSRRRRAA